jgi:lysophospholipase L1-like esterase
MPNCSNLFDGQMYKLDRVTEMKTNSEGLRDYEFPIEKPNNTIRIIVLGDSYTEGVGVEINETYSKQLEILLNNNSKTNIEVFNFGVSGYNTLDEVNIFFEKGVKYNADIILIGYLYNDIDNQTQIRKITNYLLEKKKLPGNENLDIWKEKRKIIQKERTHVSHSEQFKIINESLNLLASNINEEIEVLIFSFWGTPKWQNEFLNSICKKRGWHIIQLNWIQNKYLEDVDIHPKDAHPSRFAHNLVAKKLYSYLISEFPEIKSNKSEI